MPRAVGFTIVWPEGVIFGSIMTYHVQILLLVRQPLFDRAALLLTQTSWVLPPLSVGKMTLRLYGALNYSHGLSKGPSFGTGRGRPVRSRRSWRSKPCNQRWIDFLWSTASICTEYFHKLVLAEGENDFCSHTVPNRLVGSGGRGQIPTSIRNPS